jgi:hypothetical protein
MRLRYGGAAAERALAGVVKAETDTSPARRSTALSATRNLVIWLPLRRNDSVPRLEACIHPVGKMLSMRRPAVSRCRRAGTVCMPIRRLRRS